MFKTIFGALIGLFGMVNMCFAGDISFGEEKTVTTEVQEFQVLDLDKDGNLDFVIRDTSNTLKYILQENNIPTEGLVAYYPFNGNANDESGNGNNGTENGATLTEDRFGNAESAYSFGGEDDYIGDIPHTSIFAEMTSMTITAWYYSNKDQQDNDAIISKSNNTNDGYDWIFLEFGSHFYVNTPSGLKVVTITEPSLNTWHFAVGIIEPSGANTRVSIYIDGSLIQSKEISGNWSHSTSHLRISDYNSPSSVWDGKIDDIRIYNRALSEPEIQALYNEEN